MIILSTEDNFTCLEAIVKFSEELTCEVAAFYFKSLDVTLLSFYRSPNGDFERFLDIFENIVSHRTCSGRVILCGDFNVQFLKLDAQARAFCDLAYSYGFDKLIFEPTRQLNCIDNIFKNF